MPARPAGDPAPLPYLQVTGDRTWHIDLQVALRTGAMQARGDTPFVVSRVDFAEAMYWSPAQLVTHHGSNGCNLLPGDLLGSGTVGTGCLLEVKDSTLKRWLEPGDTVRLEIERLGSLPTPIVARA